MITWKLQALQKIRMTIMDRSASTGTTLKGLDIRIESSSKQGINNPFKKP